MKNTYVNQSQLFFLGALIMLFIAFTVGQRNPYLIGGAIGFAAMGIFFSTRSSQ